MANYEPETITAAELTRHRARAGRFIRLLEVDGAKFDLNGQGLTVEHYSKQPCFPDDPTDGAWFLDIAAWGATWMIGIQVQPSQMLVIQDCDH